MIDFRHDLGHSDHSKGIAYDALQWHMSSIFKSISNFRWTPLEYSWKKRFTGGYLATSLSIALFLHEALNPDDSIILSDSLVERSLPVFQ